MSHEYRKAGPKSCFEGISRRGVLQIRTGKRYPRPPVVSGDTSRFGVIVVVQLVEFIRSVDVHVLVKVVLGTHFDVFNQIRIAAGEASTRLQVLAFGLYVADGRTQAEVKLILYNCFKVLSFTSEVVIFFRVML